MNPGLVRAISLWNPHATLMVLGQKRNETRSKPTNIRGTVYIHSSQNHSWHHMCHIPEFFDALTLNGVTPRELKYGYILGSVDIIDCKPVDEVFVSRLERRFGNYGVGRFCWMTDNYKKLDKPIPYKGSRGFFWVPEYLISL